MPISSRSAAVRAMDRDCADDEAGNLEALKKATHANSLLESKFADRLQINRELSRSVVSFQANRSEPTYRWFKYREGFSRALIDYVLDDAKAKPGQVLLDPFAGTAAACFTANARGLKTVAIELLPVGAFFIRVRKALEGHSAGEISGWAAEVKKNAPWRQGKKKVPFHHIRITEGAFAPEVEEEMGRYRAWVGNLRGAKKAFCDLLSYSVLEEVSFTRKDGQYLRWDSRSPRTRNAGKFNKGAISSFGDAINTKCDHVIADLSDVQEDLFAANRATIGPTDLMLYEGSNFENLEKIAAASVDFVVTSPPYCNRYDYTRTYALELAYLGCTESEVRDLRQALLSCTVENRRKNLEGIVPPGVLESGKAAFDHSAAMRATLEYLNYESERGALNNNGIVKMVEGYFTEMAIHVGQLKRVVKPGGRVYLVNDNVRYNGLDVPVDCILSSFAESQGFECKTIWVLPVGKGNSSQQMKRHGRSELRKCVYVWERVTGTAGRRSISPRPCACPWCKG